MAYLLYIPMLGYYFSLMYMHTQKSRGLIDKIPTNSKTSLKRSVDELLHTVQCEDSSLSIYIRQIRRFLDFFFSGSYISCNQDDVELLALV
jgi:hypothetical protein